MISIPGSRSFSKLVMTSSAPAKSAGGARYTSQDPLIHSLIVPYNLDSDLCQECVLTTSNEKMPNTRLPMQCHLLPHDPYPHIICWNLDNGRQEEIKVHVSTESGSTE